MPITDETPKADLEDVIVYLGPDCHLVQYPLRKGELLNAVAVFKSPSFERGEEQCGEWTSWRPTTRTACRRCRKH